MKNKGFLLFEVLVTIVIVTAGLLFIIHSYSASKNLLNRSTEIFMQRLLLEGKVWEFEEKGEVPLEQESGWFTDFEGYSWQIDVEPLADSNLNRFTLSVFETNDPENTQYSISTYLWNKTS